MLNSMTGFARTQKTCTLGNLIIEIRSVNHRYLDMSFKVPEGFRELEQSLRKLISEKISRGKVDSVLSFKLSAEATSQGFVVNQALLASLDNIQNDLLSQYDIDKKMSMEGLLNWPNVIQSQAVDFKSIYPEIIETYANALDQIVDTRRMEGENIVKIISDKLVQLSILVKQAAAHFTEVKQQLQLKLKAKVDSLKVEVEAGRFEQELVYLLNKADVMEELDRLTVHTQEIGNRLTKSEPVGRRLDFLMQELNREANTLTSKSTDPELTQLAVEMKVLIEQMREQIQNLE